MSHIQTLGSLIGRLVYNNEFDTAMEALGLYVRTPGSDIKTIWDLAICSLINKDISLQEEDNDNEYFLPKNAVAFLEWLIIRYPPIKRLKELKKISNELKGKKLSNQIKENKNENLRANDFYPILLMLFLIYGKYSQAYERLEENLLAPPYNTDPILLALKGFTCICIASQNDCSNKFGFIHEATDAFEMCRTNGGTLPEDIIQSLLEDLDVDKNQSKT